MAGAAQVPGREMSEEEFLHICHRYRIAVELSDEKIVLDVGCGAGLGLPSLASRATRVVATDLFEENIRLASTFKGPRIEVRVMDAHTLAYPSSTFDVVLAMEVVQYLRIEEFLNEAFRVLKPGGTLFLCIPNPDRPGFLPGQGTLGYFSAGRLTTLLEAAGFSPLIRAAFTTGAGAKVAAEARNGALRAGVKILDLLRPVLPVRRIKDALRTILNYKPVRLAQALEEGHLAATSSIPLEDLTGPASDTRHIFLYAFARKLEVP